MANNVPLDYDEVDYPEISVYRLKNKDGVYFIITREDEKGGNFEVTDIIHGELIPFDSLLLIC